MHFISHMCLQNESIPYFNVHVCPWGQYYKTISFSLNLCLKKKSKKKNSDNVMKSWNDSKSQLVLNLITYTNQQLVFITAYHLQQCWRDISLAHQILDSSNLNLSAATIRQCLHKSASKWLLGRHCVRALISSTEVEECAWLHADANSDVKYWLMHIIPSLMPLGSQQQRQQIY